MKKITVEVRSQRSNVIKESKAKVEEKVEESSDSEELPDEDVLSRYYPQLSSCDNCSQIFSA